MEATTTPRRRQPHSVLQICAIQGRYDRHNCEAGRLRKDCALDNGLRFRVSGGQLLRGAALNAVLIAGELLKYFTAS